MQAPSIRSQISKHGLEKLIDCPELRNYVIAEEIVSGGKVRFASSRLGVKSRVSADTCASVNTTLREALVAGVPHGNVVSGNDPGNDSRNRNDSDKVESTFSDGVMLQVPEEPKEAELGDAESRVQMEFQEDIQEEKY
jgi:hypothetical protein